MSKSLRNLVTAAATAALFVGGSAVLAEAPASPKDLNDYLCKDVMRLSGSERENALALVHGYRLGKKNTTQFEVATLAALTDKFIDHCLDNPNDKALPVFEKLGE